MKAHKLFLMGLLSLATALTACGGGGGGGGAPGAPAPPAAGPVASIVFQPAVSLDNLGAPGAGIFGAGIAVNNNGLVIGVSDDGSGILAATWDITAAGAVTMLAPLGADTYSAAYGLNDGDIAVGESGTVAITAVYWDMTVLPAAPAPVALDTTGFVGDNTAYGINSLDEIVGEAEDVLGNTEAIYWGGLAAVPVVLNHLTPAFPGGPSSSAYFINDGGVIVGESINGVGQFQAVAWIPVAAGVYGAPVPLDILNPAQQVASVAFGVDNAGNIAGEVQLNTGVVHGVVWDTTGAILSDTGADTSVQAISPGAGTNRIAGYVDALSGADRLAIWNLTDLSDSQQAAVPFSQAYGINNASQIVGVMNSGAFVLIPQ